MAKLAFSKLKCNKINTDVKTFEFAGEQVEVKQYLPIQEKLEMLSKVASLAHEEDYNYNNVLKMKVYLKLHFVFYYTNLTFTQKNLEDLGKLYDQISSSGLLDQVLASLPEDEYSEMEKDLGATLKAIYKYQNSIYGILESFGAGDISLEEIAGLQKQVDDMADSKLVKNILPLLGSNETIESV